MTTIHPKYNSILGCLYSPTILFFVVAINITANVIGKINPFNEPASTSNVAGFPKKIKIQVETKMNPIIVSFSFLFTTGINVFKNDTEKKVDLGSLMFQIADKEEINNPNNVKVITDQQGFALYFSRSVIPYPREENVGVRYMKHIGIYAFRKEALMDFYHLPMLSLEASEKLEQLRYLEYGKRIKMVETSHGSIGIDTPEDLEKARKLL